MKKMNEETAARAWELAARICNEFDCRELTPMPSDDVLEALDLITEEMRSQAGRLRAEVVAIRGVHGNLVVPKEEEYDEEDSSK